MKDFEENMLIFSRLYAFQDLLGMTKGGDFNGDGNDCITSTQVKLISFHFALLHSILLDRKSINEVSGNTIQI
jgi:hypothetical protein